ncbi:MAG: hypothetical protein ACHQUC_01195 [Chlamydiales bacterium]
MAELFQKDIRTISEHIQNIYKEKELSPNPTIRKFRIVQIEGTREIARSVGFYNLNVIIFDVDKNVSIAQMSKNI